LPKQAPYLRKGYLTSIILDFLPEFVDVVYEVLSTIWFPEFDKNPTRIKIRTSLEEGSSSFGYFVIFGVNIVILDNSSDEIV